MIHLYYGNGKGKTTAAAGLAVRAAGQGWRVFFLQFLKGGPSGEVTVLEQLPDVTVKRLSEPYGFTFQMSEETKERVRAEHRRMLQAALRELREDRCGLLVLDEIGSALRCGLAETETVKNLLAEYGQTREIVMTAHEPPDWLKESSDYCTEFRKIRHPFDRGIGAREGIEY